MVLGGGVGKDATYSADHIKSDSQDMMSSIHDEMLPANVVMPESYPDPMMNCSSPNTTFISPRMSEKESDKAGPTDNLLGSLQSLGLKDMVNQ